MSENMLGKALRNELGPLEDLIGKLRGKEGIEWHSALKRFLRKENPWETINKKTNTSLLKLISTISIPATTKKFVAKDKFKVDIGYNAQVKISEIGDRFNLCFLDGEGKIESPISENKLNCYKLASDSIDEPIIAELGGAKNIETSLSTIYFLMQKQNKGQNYYLSTNKRSNIFYVYDTKGILQFVFVVWKSNGWYIGANCATCASGSMSCSWFQGDYIYSHKS